MSPAPKIARRPSLMRALKTVNVLFYPSLELHARFGDKLLEVRLDKTHLAVVEE